MSYRVGLDAHLLSLTQSYRGAGINGYIHHLLHCLPDIDHGLEYTAYFHDPAYRAPRGIRTYRTRWDTRRPWRRILWEQTRLAVLSRQLDLLHGMAFACPLAAACPTVVTVHDLSFLRFPAAFRRFNRVYLRLVTQASTRRAERVIAVSESTRQDVINLCGAPAERVTVVPNGITPEFCPAGREAVNEFREQRGLPQRFMLFLGTLEPRKNLVRLIDAYADWRQATGRPVKLVIAGARGWFYEQVFARVLARNIVDDVVFPGFVPGDELPWWYRAAEVFVYPSLFEGFGLPVLEAMACGTPVITSNTSSLPEVAGDAAVLVDPADTAALSAAMEEILADPAYAVQLRAHGLRQASQFSWARTAQTTAQIYRSVLEARREA